MGLESSILAKKKKAKNAKKLKWELMGAREWRIHGKLVGAPSPTGLKKGGHDPGASPYHFPI